MLFQLAIAYLIAYHVKATGYWYSYVRMRTPAKKGGARKIRPSESQKTDGACFFARTTLLSIVVHERDTSKARNPCQDRNRQWSIVSQTTNLVSNINTKKHLNHLQWKLALLLGKTYFLHNWCSIQYLYQCFFCIPDNMSFPFLECWSANHRGILQSKQQKVVFT